MCYAFFTSYEYIGYVIVIPRYEYDIVVITRVRDEYECYSILFYYSFTVSSAAALGLPNLNYVQKLT